MNNLISGEEILESGKSVVKQVSDQVVKQATITAQTARGQLSGPGTNEDQSANQQNQTGDPQDDTKDIVKNLYGITPNQSQQKPLTGPDGKAPQTEEEARKLAEARKQLQEQHMITYYKPTFETPKPPEPEVAEKLEQEKQQEEMKKMEELQEERKKNEVPLAVQMAAQKAEKHPGASG